MENDFHLHFELPSDFSMSSITPYISEVSSLFSHLKLANLHVFPHFGAVPSIENSFKVSSQVFGNLSFDSIDLKSCDFCLDDEIELRNKSGSGLFVCDKRRTSITSKRTKKSEMQTNCSNQTKKSAFSEIITLNDSIAKVKKKRVKKNQGQYCKCNIF